MIISMDLNASPLPEDGEEEIFGEHVEEETAEEEHVETAVETLRREREERRRKLKREHPDDESRQTLQPPKVNSMTQNKRFYDKSKLPPGWLDCPRFGQNIGPLIPSKVPLGESFNEFIEPGKRYSLKQVVHRQRVTGREIGMVIDLTNTTRYYRASECKDFGLKHVKIACKGRDAVPDNESVNQFVHEVSQFHFRQRHTKKYVLVHCTHGHNRTGFMIIHFLMRSQPLSVTEAIQQFAAARPPGIYKQDYIDALYRFYHERKPETVVCPATPEWKGSSGLDLNGEAVQDEDDDGGHAAALQLEEPMENEVLTNDDILGDAIPYDQQDDLRQFLYHVLKPKGPKGFPGSHPVSLNRDNLQLLRQRYYYATWKADGTRYMMLITSHGCYLIDRTFSFRRVQMRFPVKNPEGGVSERTHHLTLLDGEMVIDTLPNTRKLERRYLIYDLIALNMQSIVERPFYERWKLLEKEVIEPRNHERSNIHQSRNPYYRYDLEPFRVRRKDFWLLSTVTKLLKEFIPRLSHAADGLIFQGWDDPYVPRTHEGLLKWKYPEMNSVDFLFEVGDDDLYHLSLFERGKKKLLEGNRVIFRDESDVSQYSSKIIECSWDMNEHSWVFMRIRTDKTTPNEFNTYRKVMKSIQDNITEEDLLKEIGEIIRLPMYKDRIQNDSKAHHMHHPQHATRRR